MDFVSAAKSGFAKYFDFQGRASRSEFWYFSLLYLLTMAAAVVLDLNVLKRDFAAFTVVAHFTFWIPNISVFIRRMHDLNRTGWWYLVLFVPVIGGITAFILLCKKGTDGPNRYGEAPRATAALAGYAS